MSGIEMRPRKPRKPIKQERQSVEPTIVAQIEEDLRDLFRSAENPIAILLQTMETDEFKDIVSEELANPVKALLQTLTFLNEDDFVAKVIAQWFQIFRQEQQREATGVKELLEYIVQKQQPPFIINHADLLRQDLLQEAEMVVFLNPKKEEQLKSRQLRTDSGAEGEWQAVSADDYDAIAEQNLAQLQSLGGEEKYMNEKSGTSIHVLKSI